MKEARRIILDYELVLGFWVRVFGLGDEFWGRIVTDSFMYTRGLLH